MIQDNASSHEEQSSDSEVRELPICSGSVIVSGVGNMCLVPDGQRYLAGEEEMWTSVDRTERDGGDQYYTFQLRLDTFRRWPTWAGVAPEDLSREGFYYTGIRDEVRCFTCERLLRLWRPGEDIRERHRRYSPNCPFLASLEATHLGHTKGKLFSSVSCQASRAVTSTSQRPTSSDDMSFEEKRLATYGGYPKSSPVQPAELAHAGFYFTGRDDGVQCFSCRVALRGWEKGDTAEGEHRRHNPFCPFLNNKDNTNVPIQLASASPISSAANRQYQLPQGIQFEHIRFGTFRNWPSIAPVSPEDLAETGFFYVGERDAVRCFHCFVQIEQWVPGDIPVDEHIKHSPDCTFARAVAQRKRQYEGYTTVNAEATAERMKSYEHRLESFRNWPQPSHVSAESLARAGFYYLGSRDTVKCFTCGVTLKQWQPGDNAWDEHVKYVPSCQFVQEHHPAVVPSHDEPWSAPATGKESTSWPLSSTSVSVADFTQQAMGMGFSRDLAIQVLERFDIRNVSFSTYLDALLATQQEVEQANTTTAHKFTSGSMSATTLPNTPSTGTALLQPTAPPEVEETHDELEQIQESRNCKICMEHEATVLFLPCAHILCCEGCSRNIHDCPVCRVSIQQKIRSYFA